MEKSLTKQQQELVENNHNLIYKFAHNNNLSIDEYYDILAIGLCYAAQTYDKSKNAFSTLAYACMKNELFDYWAHIQTKGVIPSEKIISYDVPNSLDEVSSNDGFKGLLVDNNCPYDIVSSNMMFESFSSKLTDKEKVVVDLLMNSIPQVEIAERMGCSKQNVACYVNRVRQKLKKHLKNWENYCL